MGRHPLLLEPLQTRLPHNFTTQLEAFSHTPQPSPAQTIAFLLASCQGGWASGATTGHTNYQPATLTLSP